VSTCGRQGQSLGGPSPATCRHLHAPNLPVFRVQEMQLIAVVLGPLERQKFPNARPGDQQLFEQRRELRMPLAGRQECHLVRPPSRRGYAGCPCVRARTRAIGDSTSFPSLTAQDRTARKVSSS
jgi:hypothetical protein